MKRNIHSFEQFFDSLLYYPFLLNYGAILSDWNIKQCHVTYFVSIWNVELDFTIFSTFATTMRPTSAAKHSSVLSLLKQGYSYCQIHNETSISLGTINNIRKEVDANKENNPGGCPSKLSTHDKQSIIQQINSGRFDNAVQAANFINSTLTHSVHPQKLPGVH